MNSAVSALLMDPQSWSAESLPETQTPCGLPSLHSSGMSFATCFSPRVSEGFASPRESNDKFNSLLQQLLQAHVDEVALLRRRIRDLEKMGFLDFENGVATHGVAANGNGVVTNGVGADIQARETTSFFQMQRAVRAPSAPSFPQDIVHELEKTFHLRMQEGATKAFKISFPPSIMSSTAPQELGDFGNDDLSRHQNAELEGGTTGILAWRESEDEEGEGLVLSQPTSSSKKSKNSSGRSSRSAHSMPEHVLAMWRMLTTQVLSGGRSVFTVLPGWSAPPIDHQLPRTETGIERGSLNSTATRTSDWDGNDDRRSQQRRGSACDQPYDPNAVAIQKSALERLEQKFIKEKRRKSAGQRVSLKLTVQIGRTSSGGKAKPRRFCSRTFVMHPASKKRLIWIIGCFALLFYEILMVSMEPFGLQGEWTEDLDLFSACFWTADIFLNFLSGIFANGKAEMRFNLVAKRYLEGWFCFDCVIASLQWYAIYDHLAGAKEAGKVSTPGFLLKFFRLFRLLRLGKLTNLLTVEEMSIAALGSVTHHFIHHIVFGSKIVNCLFGIILYVHFLACLWYEVGKQDSNGWVYTYDDNLKEHDIWHNYLVSVHWTLSQFQGNIDIYPGNSTGDRVFAIVSSCLSIVTLAMFVSTMTDVLVNLREDRKKKGHEAYLMRGLLDRHQMPTELLARATYFIRSRQQQQRHRETLDEDAKALLLFPKHLSRHMYTEMVARSLCGVPLFAYLRNYHYKVLITLCSNAITNQMFDSEEDLFSSGDLAKQCFTIVTGECIYSASAALLQVTSMLFQKGGEVGSEDSDVTMKSYSGELSNQVSELTRGMHDRRRAVRRPGQGEFVSEAALWMSFNHDGDLACASTCQCLLMCSTDLINTVGKHIIPHMIFTDYAVRYVQATEAIKRTSENRVFIDLLDTKAILAFLAKEARVRESGLGRLGSDLSAIATRSSSMQ